MNKIDFNYIVNTVIDFYEEYDITKIEILEIINKTNITLIPYSVFNTFKQNICESISNDGFSIEHKGKWIIFYNDNVKNYGRIKYTIFHEIGHFQLGHIKEGMIEEQEANFFAKYALAPPPLINQLPSISVSLIQSEFGISLEAAFYAYSYYQKWLQYGGENYTEQEKKLIKRFKVA